MMLNRRVIRLLFFVLFLTCFVLLLFIPTADMKYVNTAESARESVWRAITSGGCSSATVAVMDGGKFVYSEGFGAANRKDGRNVNKTTRFNVGSTSKIFTATALLMLVDEEKISLDDPVTKYLPEFTMKDDRYRDITVRMLMNHSSGLPGSSFFFCYTPHGDTHKMLLERLKESNLKHAPGEMGVYCNDGFTLAEMIIEKISGQKFIAFLSERIFRPLKMHNTYASVGEVSGDIADFYDPQSGEKLPPEVILVHAAGGLSSTAEDMCRFADSFCSGGKKILSNRSLEEMLKSQPTPFSSKLRGSHLLDSFGWDYSYLPNYDSLGIDLYSKTGGTGAYSTGLLIIPDKRLAVVASLSGRTSGEYVARSILDGLLKDKGLPVPSKQKVVCPPEAEIIRHELDIFEGFYTNGGNFIKIKFDSDRKGMKTTDVLSDSDKIFHGAAEGAGSHFVYSNGSFVAFDINFSGYFLKDEEHLCFVSEKDPLYGADVVMCQSVPKLANPKKLFTDVDGKLWLMRNLPASSQFSREAPVAKSSTFKELPGYLTLVSPLRVEDEHNASYAAPFFRDQSELSIYEKDSVLWAKSNVFLFSDANAVQSINPGENMIVIGNEGHSEWRRVESGTLLSFELPFDGRIMVIAGDRDNSVIYDSILSTDEIYAPPGSYVASFGLVGDKFTVISK